MINSLVDPGLKSLFLKNSGLSVSCKKSERTYLILVRFLLKDTSSFTMGNLLNVDTIR